MPNSSVAVLDLDVNLTSGPLNSMGQMLLHTQGRVQEHKLFNYISGIQESPTNTSTGCGWLHNRHYLWHNMLIWQIWARY